MRSRIASAAGIFYQLVEGIGRKLRGDHRMGDVDTLIENLQQFPGGRNGDRAEVEIIEHGQIHLAIEIHYIAMAPVSSGESELLDEVAGAMVPQRHLVLGGFGGYHTRLLFNQAFFAKIHIDEDDETRERSVRVDYNEPFYHLLSGLVPDRVHHDLEAKKTAHPVTPDGR